MSLVHIYAPKGHYIGQIRRTGHRLWETVGDGKHTQETAAMVCAVAAMTEDHKRARVLFVTEWHDPVIIMECNR
jgi:hypothetical protein